MGDDRGAVRTLRDEVLLHPVAVLRDERIGDGENLRRGAVVAVHENRPRARERLVEVEQEPHVGAAPGVDRLVGVAHDEQVPVVRDEDLQQPVLQRVDVLKLVHHDVFEPLLPLAPHRLVEVERQQRKEDQVVVVEREALLRLPQVAVEEDVVQLRGRVVLRLERLGGRLHDVGGVVRLLEALADLEAVARLGERPVAQREAALGVDLLEEVVDVGVVEHDEALRVADHARVLAQDADAEPVERVDVARVRVPDEPVDALAHLDGGLVGEGDAEDVPGQDAEVANEPGEPAGERAGLARSGAGDDADEALGGGDRGELFRIEPAERVGGPGRRGGGVCCKVVHAGHDSRFRTKRGPKTAPAGRRRAGGRPRPREKG